MRAARAGTKMADGRWRIMLTLTDPLTGAKTKKPIYAKTRHECTEKANAYLAENGRSTPNTAKLTDLISECERGPWVTLKPNTVSAYRHCLPRFRRYLPDIHVAKLEPSHVSRMMALMAREDPPLSGRTIQMHRNVLSVMLGYAREIGWIRDNPARGVRLPRSAAPREFPAIDETAFRLIVAHGGNRRLLWWTLGETGLRPAEAFDLTPDSIVWQHDHHWVRVGDSKTASGRGRLVPISDELARELTQLDGPLLFASRQNILRDFRATLTRAGLEQTRPYELRKLAITRWVMKGVPPEVTKVLAGHSDYALTIDVYTRLSKQRVAEAVLPSGVSSGVSVAEILAADGPDFPG